MAAFDKFNLMERLERLGWKERADLEEPYQMEPPESLFDKRPRTFYVYDAETLQSLLGSGVGDSNGGDAS